jgi:hypothetical protein
MVTRDLNDHLSVWKRRSAGILPAVLEFQERLGAGGTPALRTGTTWFGEARRYRLRIERALRGGCNDVARQSGIKAGLASAEAAGRQPSRARQALATRVAAPARLQIRLAIFPPGYACAFPGQDRTSEREPWQLQRGRYNQEIERVRSCRKARPLFATTGRMSRSRPEKYRI